MKYDNYLDIIKNNINLFNCIKLKFQDGYKLDLGFEIENKTYNEVYYYQSIDLKTGKIVYTSQKYGIKELEELNKDIELLIYENLNHLKDILENHLKIND